MSRRQIALVSRELRPFGGGIGTYVAELARFLSRDADVSVFVSAGRSEQLQDPDIRRQTGLDASVNVVFVPDPSEPGSYYGHLHRYSANVLAALRREYGTHGPDLIEFQDYLGEGAVTVQARVTRERFLERTPVMVRLNTSAELCAMLDGYVDQGDAARHIFALERFALRFADRLLYGGGDIYGLYRRAYGQHAVAPGALVRQPLGPTGPIAAPLQQAGLADEGPLRLLYIGRLERRKGIIDLVHAVTTLNEPVALTMIGGDTPTGPLGVSMRAMLHESDQTTWPSAAASIDLIDHLAPSELPEVIDSHHLLVIPSIWECWPAVGLEALARNRPILATPVGGLKEMAQPRSGWMLPASGDRDTLTETIEHLARDRAEINRLVEEHGPRAVHEELCDGDALREWYLGSGFRSPRREPVSPPKAEAAHPLVSIIVPYYGMSRYVEDTIESVMRQTHPRLEVVIVNDGSFGLEDRMIVGLARRCGVRVAVQPNSGLGAARNFGIKLSRGRFVLPLDADNLIEPTFVERTVEVLLADPAIAYASSWSRYIDEQGMSLAGPGGGYQPLGNSTELLQRENAGGDATALVRRSVYDRGYWYSEELTSYEDWDFYRRLALAGLVGHCIPERLMRYRVRDGSMVRELGHREFERFQGELVASWRSSEVAWR